jgi:hypothetical protein
MATPELYRSVATSITIPREDTLDHNEDDVASGGDNWQMCVIGDPQAPK